MTTRFGSKFVSLALVAPFVALAACAPAPAKLLNPADERALKIMVAPPVPCSDLKVELVNSYAGCENYGGMMDGDKFTKYSRPVDDAAMMTTVDVRCYDLLPERIGSYGVCAPTVLVIAKLADLPGDPLGPPSTPETPDPTVDHAQNTSGTGANQTHAEATRDSSGLRDARANTGNADAQASSQENPNGTSSVSAGNISATRNSDGSYSGVSFAD